MSHSITSSNSVGDYPPEPKVIAATAAATAVAFILDAIANIAQSQDTGALIKTLPDAAEPFILALVLAVPTFVAGYQAKHQHRRIPAPGRAPDVE